MYIEQKSDGATGSARIGRVFFSKRGKTLYYGGRAFQRAKGRGIEGNYFDIETEDEYWISGCKRNGADRLFGGLAIEIDDDVREEYWRETRKAPGRVQERIANR